MLRSRLEVFHFLIDILVIIVSMALSTVIRTNVDIGIPASDDAFIMPPVLYFIVLIVWMLIFYENDVYLHKFGTKFRYQLLNVIKSHVIACFLYFGVLYLTYRNVSRLQSFYFITLALVGMIGARLLIRLIQIVFLEGEASKIRVLMVGTGISAIRLQKKFEENPRNNLRVVGFVRFPKTEDPPAEITERTIGTVDDLISLVEQKKADEVVIAPHWYSKEISDQISEIMYQLQKFPVNVRLAPDYSEISFFQVVTENFEGLPLLGLRTPIFSPRQRLLKRCLDLAIALPIMLVGLPVLTLIAIAIRLDSEGPIILRQKRVGIHGNTFSMYKFRSMYNNINQLQFDETKLDVIKRPDDPRVTRVGRFLRRTSLDELPQLINVVLGDMSLVGPRPELPARVQSYEWWQFKRFEVPQGMTGWWQINGRANRPMHLNTEDDLYYIQNYSLWLDLQILFYTLKVVLTGEGAF